MVFALGPAGSGKTYLAVAMGVSLLLAGKVERIVLSRPAVEAGERLGFLPGDMKEKIDPYLRPLYDALHDMLPAEQIANRMESGEIEIAPLAFMRGRTLAHCYVILDEAQNTTPMQMRMFLTRLGEGSRMVITGDPSQTDLPGGQRSGLTDAVDTLKDVEGVRFVRLTSKDVVRHDLVTRIVEAYDARDKKDQAGQRVEPSSCSTPAWAKALPGVERLVRKARARRAPAQRRERSLTVALPTTGACGRLNTRDRRKDKPTNVLSYPSGERVSWATSCWRARPCGARRRAQRKTPADHVTISSCMARCICWATITRRATPTPSAWKRWSGASLHGSGSPIHTRKAGHEMVVHDARRAGRREDLRRRRGMGRFRPRPSPRRPRSSSLSLPGPKEFEAVVRGDKED